jgi:hypothetical protein
MIETRKTARSTSRSSSSLSRRRDSALLQDGAFATAAPIFRTMTDRDVGLGPNRHAPSSLAENALWPRPYSPVQRRVAPARQKSCHRSAPVKLLIAPKSGKIVDFLLDHIARANTYLLLLPASSNKSACQLHVESGRSPNANKTVITSDRANRAADENIVILLLC